MNVADYGSATRDELLAELVRVSDLLAADQVSLAGFTADRERVYWDAYDRCDSTQTVSSRDKTAQSAALSHALAVIDTRGSIESRKTVIALIRDLLA